MGVKKIQVSIDSSRVSKSAVLNAINVAGGIRALDNTIPLLAFKQNKLKAMKTSDNQIKKILCPIDFSPKSLDGLDYAGRLAQALQATLTLFYASETGETAEAQLYEDQNNTARATRRQLHLETNRIESKFGITCDACIESTAMDSELSIGEASASYDLTVVGTSGTDYLYKHIFGTDSHHTLGLTKCPVLLIPGSCSERIPREIVYAFDPETNPQYVPTDLEGLAGPLKAKIRPLYVVPEPKGGLLEASQFPDAMIGVHNRWGFDWDLDPICSDEIVSALDRYMRSHKSSILALSCHHRALFEQLFEESVIGEISQLATYPVLVFWH